MAAEGNIDVMVMDTFFRDRTGGVMVEVGAARPDYLSIGANFRAQGWKVVSIEPNPDFCAAHRARGHDVLEYACSDEESDDAPFFVVDSTGTHYRGGAVSFESFSSLGIKGQFADLYETVKAKTGVKTIPVKVRKLDTVLADHEPGLGEIDVLAVDVEGWELNVMRGVTLDKYRPKIVILENIFRDKDLTAYMADHGYGLWKKGHIELNDIYVRLELLGHLMRNKGIFATVAERLGRLLRGLWQLRG